MQIKSYHYLKEKFQTVKKQIVFLAIGPIVISACLLTGYIRDDWDWYTISRYLTWAYLAQVGFTFITASVFLKHLIDALIESNTAKNPDMNKS